MKRVLGNGSRRTFLTVVPMAGLVAACGNGVGSDGAERIDRAADASLDFLYDTNADARVLAGKASGVLIMPEITEAGLGVGGSFGRGVLRINNVPVDYYSATQASFGFQIGAQQFSHVLFFMTEDALSEFRTSDGWAAGADVEYALNSEGLNLAVDTTSVLSPVVAVVFAQAGLLAGATLEGTKYTRIIP